MFSARIKQDHQVILTKYQQLWTHGSLFEGPPDKTKALIVELVKLIMIHSGAETSVLYPILNQIPKQGKPAAEKAVSEHAEVEFLLYQLERMDPLSTEFFGTLKKVMGMFKKHSDEEESMLLPEIDNYLQSKGGDMMARTIAEYEYSKTHAPTVPHPAINREGDGRMVAASILKTAEEAARMSSAETAHHMKHAHGVPIHAQEPNVVAPPLRAHAHGAGAGAGAGAPAGASAGGGAGAPEHKQ